MHTGRVGVRSSFEGFSVSPTTLRFLEQASFVLSSSFYLCLCFSFSSRLIVLVEVERMEEVGSSEEAGLSGKVSLSEEIGRLLGSGGEGRRGRFSVCYQGWF